MSPRRLTARPRLGPWLLLLLAGTAVWLMATETVFPFLLSTEEPIPVSHRLSWWLLPPLVAVLTLFAGQWALASSRVNAADAEQRRQADADHAAQAEEAQATLDARARQQFSLEIRSVGLTVERFRQMAVWQRLDEVNDPYRSILSQNPNDYEWAAQTRRLIHSQRGNNTWENALRLWVERWPIPVLVADGMGLGINRILWADNGAGLGLHIYTALGVHQGEGADVLVKQLFQAFDDNPELPAVLLFCVDSQENYVANNKDARFVPTLPDSMAALLVTRTDRVDRYIRPYVVDVPYNINMDHTRYDVIKLWNFYFQQQKEYWKTPGARDTMPTAYWNERVRTLIAQINHDAAQNPMTPFWDRGETGFKPSPWVPVRWTRWQLEDEYDRAPIVGHLHRPVEVTLQGGEADRAAAIAAGWREALATLPEGVAPQWLFYDTAGEGARIVPFDRAMHLADTPHPVDFSDAEHSYDLTRRIANTGVASPFVQLALATMRSYHKGGVSATVNLRQDGRASIIMVSPPTPEEKARNKPNPYNSKHPDDPDPFVSKVM